MVAYSFQGRFVDPIRAGTKRQTIRANGKRRHARPGDALQLYCGMRTRNCFKIIEVDPVCREVSPIRFDLSNANLFRPYATTRLYLDGIDLSPEGRDKVASLDGFATFSDMVAFWLDEHGRVVFEGVCIAWL